MFTKQLAHYRNRQDVDMTHGGITRHIVAFAVPLMIGSVFQQMYNMVDTWVVGNYVSNEAFSAVGSVGPIINLLISSLIGLSSGTGVIISQYYGAHRWDDVHDAVHTAAVMTLITGVIFTGVGMFMTRSMLRFMNTPAEVLPEAVTYLTIYFSGLIGLLVYNMGAGILQAVGDAKRPFYYLVACAAMNTVLDLVLVLKFKMGIAGVAWATILSQGVSAVLVMITLLRTTSCVKLNLFDLKIHAHLLKKILTIGIPAAFQTAVPAFLNILIQSHINYFGADCMSGWTVYAKVDQLLVLPLNAICLAVTAFVGQNLGCNQIDRVKQGVRTAILISCAAMIVLTIPVVIFASPIVAFFNNKPEVIEYGTLFFRWISPFYMMFCVSQVQHCALRGACNSRAPMIIVLASVIIFRQIYLSVVARFCNEIIPIVLSYPVGWSACTVMTAIYYHRVQLGKNRLVEDCEAE